MNYFDINKAIISGKKTNGGHYADPGVFIYMLRNNVANYYAKRIEGKINSTARKIVLDGNVANKKYLKTLHELNKVCIENDIPFLLFKTYKYLDEPVFNDIDIIVHAKDFHRLLATLSSEGYRCEEDEPFKGKCVKKGFLKIEPRVSVSFHGYVIFSEKEVWRNVEKVKIGDIELQKTTREFDIICLLLNILYGPNYCKLYLLKIISQADRKGIRRLVLRKKIKGDIDLLLKELFREGILDVKFPYFLSNKVFLKFWIKNVFLNPGIEFQKQLKHLVFFMYIKYKYLFFDSLHFEYPSYEK